MRHPLRLPLLALMGVMLLCSLLNALPPASLDSPARATEGQAVELRLADASNRSLADRRVVVGLPDGGQLHTRPTDASGRVSFIANEAGAYGFSSDEFELSAPSLVVGPRPAAPSSAAPPAAPPPSAPAPSDAAPSLPVEALIAVPLVLLLLLGVAVFSYLKRSRSAPRRPAASAPARPSAPIPSSPSAPVSSPSATGGSTSAPSTIRASMAPPAPPSLPRPPGRGPSSPTSGQPLPPRPSGGFAGARPSAPAAPDSSSAPSSWESNPLPADRGALAEPASSPPLPSAPSSRAAYNAERMRRLEERIRSPPSALEDEPAEPRPPAAGGENEPADADPSPAPTKPSDARARPPRPDPSPAPRVPEGEGEPPAAPPPASNQSDGPSEEEESDIYRKLRQNKRMGYWSHIDAGAEDEKPPAEG